MQLGQRDFAFWVIDIPDHLAAGVAFPQVFAHARV
jgi:hypothetical protein